MEQNITYHYAPDILTEDGTPKDIPLLDVDLDDSAEVLGGLQSLAAYAKRMPAEYAMKLFKIGILMNAGACGLSAKQLSAYMGLPRQQLGYAKHLAEKYGNDYEKMVEAYYKSGAVAFNTFACQSLTKRKRDSDPTAELRAKVSGYLQRLKHDGGDPGAYAALNSLRTAISRHVPLGRELSDPNYLKYCDCCCCGETPPQNGHSLAHYKDIPFVKYPVCDVCDEKGAEPDKDAIIKMYAAYAINIEQMIDRI